MNIKIAVRGNKAALLGPVDLIVGTVGQVCTFYFDESWKNLHKKITYKLGSNVLGAEDIINNETIFPPYVFSAAGLPLEIGITGYSADKSIVTPTSWCLLGTVKNGALSSGTGGNSGGSTGEDEKIVYDGGVLI